MTGSIFGWKNVVKTATLTASSASIALPVVNLKNDHGAPSLGWQTLQTVVSGVLLTITPAARTVFRAAGAFGTNLTGSGVMTVRVYTNPGAVLLETATATIFAGQAVAILSADRSADYMTIQFDDSTNPDGHLNVPLVYAGPVWITALGFGPGSMMGRDALSDIVQSRGGQKYVNMRNAGRRWEITLDAVLTSELWTQLDSLDQAARAGTNVLGIPDRTAATVCNDSVYGILEPTADVGYIATGYRNWRARLSERL